MECLIGSVVGACRLEFEYVPQRVCNGDGGWGLVGACVR